MTVKIGITGHRQLENPEEVRNRIEAEIQAILSNTAVKSFEAYTCLAAGSDTIFAEVALKLGGTLKVSLPFPTVEYLKDFNAEGVVLFNLLIVHDSNPTILADVPQTEAQRNEDYFQAGKYVVDHCEYLIAVWDGEQGRGKGGTTDIVAYARGLKKTVVHIQQYRCDLSRLFHYYDKKAIYYKNVYEWLWIGCILLSLFASLMLAYSVTFQPEQTRKLVVASIELIIVSLAFSVILYLQFSKFNKNRIASRRTAERLRVLERFHNSGINIEKLEHFEGLPEEVASVEGKYQRIEYPRTDFGNSRKNLLYLVEEQYYYHKEKRPKIIGKTFHRLERIQRWLLIPFFVGVVCHFIGEFIHDTYKEISSPLHLTGLMLSLFIPSSYAAIEGYIYFKGYKKISMDSEKMALFFASKKDLLNKIDNCSRDCFDILNTHAFDIMKNMDSETKDWSIIIGEPTPHI